MADEAPDRRRRVVKWLAVTAHLSFVGVLGFLVFRSLAFDEPLGPPWAGGAPSLRDALMSTVAAVWAWIVGETMPLPKARSRREFRRNWRIGAAALGALGLVALLFGLLRPAPRPDAPPSDAAPDAGMTAGSIVLVVILIAAGLALLILSVRETLNNAVLGRRFRANSLADLAFGPFALLVYGVGLIGIAVILIDESTR